MMGRVVLYVVTGLLSTAAFAEEPASQPGPERAIVSLQAGFASGSSHMTGAALGGTVVYDLVALLHHRVQVVGRPGLGRAAVVVLGAQLPLQG